MKYIFEVTYNQYFKGLKEPKQFTDRVSIGKYDAQLAVNKVESKALDEVLNVSKEKQLPCTDFTLLSVKFVTDYK